MIFIYLLITIKSKKWATKFVVKERILMVIKIK